MKKILPYQIVVCVSACMCVCVCACVCVCLRVCLCLCREYKVIICSSQTHTNVLQKYRNVKTARLSVRVCFVCFCVFCVCVFHVFLFTVRLHIMQRTVFPRPFCPSVRPSVKRVLCDKTEDHLLADYVKVVEDRPCPQNIVSQLHFAKTDPRSSRAVSLWQLSFLFTIVLVLFSSMSFQFSSKAAIFSMNSID